MTAGARRVAMIGALLLAAGCSVGPDYKRPRAAAPAAYKEAGDWKIAQPGDAIPHGAWWRVFGDAELDRLEARVDVSNQTLAAFEAQYRASRAAVRLARAGYFPTLTLSPSVTIGHRSSNQVISVGTTTTSAGTPVAGGVAGRAGTIAVFSLPLQLSWEIDVWGRIRRTVEANEATAQATFADLESARLSAHAALAQDYFQLRALDAQHRILGVAVANYTRVLQVAKNRYGVGVVSRADVVQAEAQLEATRAQAIDVGVQRAQLEHAIATLVGEPPSNVAIASAPLDAQPPDVPIYLPSELVERRPDVAAAERRVAAANAQIGVATAAWFPQLALGASGGLQSSSLTSLFSVPSFFWSVGPTLAQTIFDGGARSAQIAQARALHENAVASYRQAVLTAFQEVEDNLAALRILAEEAEIQARAVEAARQAVAITTNQYEAGTVSQVEVLVAQTTALNAERTAVDVMGRRMVATVLLIQALGGGWKAPGR